MATPVRMRPGPLSLLIGVIVVACGGAPPPSASSVPSASAPSMAAPITPASAADPLSVVLSWTEARNAGDVDRAMAVLADTGSIFDFSMADPTDRDRLREILEAQAVAGHRIEESDCEVDGERVTCRYRQYDALLERCGIALTGVHRYNVRDGRLTLADRSHDPESRDAAYAAAEAFRGWVQEHHPDAVDVIWVTSSDVTFTTTEGARAMMAIIGEYAC